ncbi:MAG: methyl-accepting chemotaxis protein [Bacillota bacterium]
MFKELKLGYKIAAGFMAILILSVILGGIAAFNMLKVNKLASELSNEYVPEVSIINDIYSQYSDTMFDMRGYGYTEDKAMYDEGVIHLENMKAALQEAKQLADTSVNLVKLKAEVGNIEAKVSEYEKMLKETVSKNENMAADRNNLDKAAEAFLESSYKFLTSQNEKMINEINTSAGSAAMTERLKKITTINDILDAGNAIKIAVQKAQAQRDPKIIEDAMANFDTVFSMIERIRTITYRAEDIEALNEVKEAVESYKASVTSLDINWNALQELNIKRAVISEEILKLVEGISEAGISSTMERANTTETTMINSVYVVVTGLIITVAASMILAFIIILSITRPINAAVIELGEGAAQVASASQQLSSASQQLSAANTEQAASIEETSATLEESSSMIQQNNENTRQATMLAAQTKSAADKGNAEMQEMMTSISEIKKSSDQIAKIIKVIDEIAFQTNILALNAAVEAARAGDAGMGFAVVAEEVRTLAQRSAQAAKDTEVIIENNIEMSSKGVEVAGRVGEALKDITAHAKRVNELMDEISAASQEQAQGISQISKAIVQMEKVTQQNAAASEQSASASEQLSAQAETLNDIVDKLLILVEGKRHSVNTKKSSKKLDKAVHKKAEEESTKLNKKGITSVKKHAVNPNDIIPLEDDTAGF